MIVSGDELAALRGRVTMVDGGFDPIHPGHVAYFREAAALGLPVLCNISSDDWVRSKHAPLLDQAARGIVIDAMRDIALTHLSNIPTSDVLRAVQPRYYVKGADWRDRLPEDETAVCAELGIEIVILDTMLDSSTAILQRYSERRDDHD